VGNGSITKPVGVVPCHYCQREVGPGALTFTWDHVVPRSIGGLNVRWNVVPSCRDCNSDKADEFPTHECAFCRRTRRRHWELLRINAKSPRPVIKVHGWIKTDEGWRRDLANLG
jgi:hypothetical protein